MECNGATNRMKKNLVTYAFFGREGNLHIENLNFFLKAGVNEDKLVDYNIIFTNAKSKDFNIPNLKNINVIERENEGHDFGGYNSSILSSKIDDYKNFIFANDTCTGPFLPSYISKLNIHWTDLFCSEIGEKVKLVGPTWWNTNSAYSPHIQSWCFGTDLKGLKLLMSCKKFETSNKPRSRIIPEHEVGMSKTLIDCGYEIKPFQLSAISPTPHGDINYPNKYFETTINPLEVMFLKRSRINDKITKNYMSWITSRASKNDK